ncbi:NAD(P)/FAD-dependent oxidoreductase [Frankia sp. CNm7]|uniref:Pyridine nucleotide-disulfide oxidoreductase domain-containing protein 2 n=1 Tax=Frankia nepalensis TaxID=1836974 RepID=A0A937RE52_9ACTN|nr:NAD(P)/FAD-dependent oxidoreductase [Frankia nepalensis]MBL7512445.1 NAD(P)/FAD-dependent oxidoreductase [Frankia nepalensis]MBL7523752.1 NAD(P)/FAD-dependent oxidoreductase [Frankia nepalensis]MBL7628582.1 NAD(P)/FAD-dependent oxidoreductase [Frankia nepalensis]
MAAPDTLSAPGTDELPEHADAVVIGGGHNGLACGAYLARAGRSVVVLEAREQAGGCASTVDAIGARVNICNCDHTMIRASGIIEELDLASHGLRYLDVDPMLIGVGWADEPVFIQWRSIERTLDGLARVDPTAAAAYRRYLDVALPAARLVLAVQCGRPTTPSIVATVVARQKLRGSRVLLDWPRRSLVDVLTSFGLPSWVIAATHTVGPAVWGLGPDAPGTGLGALGLAIRHLVGVGRPVGGSGAVPGALAACLRAHGGRVVTGARVTGLDVEAGRARGVRLADGGRVTAGAVVNATDPHALLVDWLDGVPAAAKLRARWAARPADDGYESKLDAVVTALPTPRAVLDLPEDVLPAALHHVPTTIVSPTPEQQIAASAALKRGLIADRPMFFLNTPSVLDETMRPGLPGGGDGAPPPRPGAVGGTPAATEAHLLSLEVLWTPWALEGGWGDPAVPWGWLERFASICAGGSGFLESVRDWRAMTPPDYEREFFLRRGYVPSFPDGVMAALLGRRRELSRYRTPVAGLYLTGGATFPGAGVWGASGRNAAATVLAAR